MLKIASFLIIVRKKNIGLKSVVFLEALNCGKHRMDFQVYVTKDLINVSGIV